MQAKYQNQTNYYSYGFRQYDAQLGRWHVVDAMAESYMSTSPYAYVMNNPINSVDALGLLTLPYLDSNYGKQKNNPYLTGAFERHFVIGAGFRQAAKNFGPGFEDYYTNIEGTWVNNGDIITIDNVNAIEFFMDNLNNGMTLTFVEAFDEIIPIASVGDLGFILFEDGAITDVGGEKAAVYLGDVKKIGNSASFSRWLKNAGTTFDMFTDWATGTGSNYRNFYNDEVSAAFRNAKGINQMRNQFYKTNKGKSILTGIPFKNPGFGISGMYNAGIDPIEQFVGSYNVKIDVVGDNLQYTIYNTTTLWSFLYHIIPSSWNPNCGPARTSSQNYIFTEPINFNRL